MFIILFLCLSNFYNFKIEIFFVFLIMVGSVGGELDLFYILRVKGNDDFDELILGFY